MDEKELFKKVIRDEFGPMKPALCKFALELVDKLSEYFWVVPASATGKFHPEHDQGEGGLARHSLMVYRWLKSLLEANEQDMSEYEPGMCLAALFHDCMKRGPTADGIAEHTLFEHPILAAKFVMDESERFLKENKEFIESTVDDEESFKHDIAVAVSCIQTHMGKWNTSKHSDVKLPKPSTPMQYMVHLADYCASRKFTKFDSDFIGQ